MSKPQEAFSYHLVEPVEVVRFPKMKYNLFYQAHLIATVEEDDADFPTFFGRYRLEPTVNAAELVHLRAYIDYCVRTWPLIEEDRFDDAAMAEEAALFGDLIDSEHWLLVDVKSQKRFPILIPIFCTDGGMNWRLNPDIKST